MANEPLPDDIRNVWQNQSVDNAAMPLEEIRRRAQKFQSKIAWRNRREYLGAAIVVITFGYYIYKFPYPMIRAGSALIIAGTLYVIYQLHRRASPQTLPSELALVGSVEFYRRQLVRQRDALQSVWKWYLSPLIPGLLVFTAGIPWGRPDPHRRSGAFYFAFIAIVFLGIWWLNRRAAARLDRQIAELDSNTELNREDRS